MPYIPLTKEQQNIINKASKQRNTTQLTRREFKERQDINYAYKNYENYVIAHCDDLIYDSTHCNDIMKCTNNCANISNLRYNAMMVNPYSMDRGHVLRLFKRLNDYYNWKDDLNKKCNKNPTVNINKQIEDYQNYYKYLNIIP